jgi:hypothetical protein
MSSPSSLRSFVSFVSIGIALHACTGDSPHDGGIDAIESGFDATTDGISDVPVDAPLCTGPAVEDLAAIGMRTADGVTYTGSNEDAPPNFVDAVQPPMDCQFRVIYQRLFSYTLTSTAALRVSTNNAGSDTAFDSVILVTPAPCTLPVRALACNDDDPYAPTRTHVTLSLATTPVLDAGTRVTIAIGGFYPAAGSGQAPNPDGAVGTFELSVREVHPVAPMDPCDASGRDSICPIGTTCLADPNDASRTICRPDGASPGAACRAAMCDAPMACDTDANRCYSTVASGARCDRLGFAAERCDTGFTCVAPFRGPRYGTCQSNGSAVFTACSADVPCAAGLFCKLGSNGATTCARLVGSGASCSTFDEACPAGESCVASENGAIRGTCTPNGTVAGSACREGTDSECDEPLFCISSFVDRACKTVGHAAGEPCGAQGACSFDWLCFSPDPTRPYEGICASPGSLGGICNVASPACSTGLTCTNAANPTQGRCVHSSITDQPCDLAARATRCTSGLSCARPVGTTTGDMGTCQPIGTVPGSSCRAMDPRCDDGLTCGSGPTPVCRRAPTSMECSPRDNSVACPTGTVCAGTSLDIGTCRTPGTESEPNERIPSGTNVPTPGAVTGSLAQYDLDCFDVTVPTNGSLFAQATTFEGQCSAALALDVYGAAGLIGSDASSGVFGCPRVDGRDPSAFGWARNLAAGTYTVCIRQNGNRTPVNSYSIAFDTSP